VGFKSVVTATPIQSLPTLDQHKLTSRVEDTAIVNAYIVALWLITAPQLYHDR
jgi:hypothetical protein